MPIGWPEIRDRAYAFVEEWKDETSEDAEAKSFWDGFFNVFGVSRKRKAVFERRVTKLSGRTGYIDVFWEGMLLAEHKSRGQDLTKATEQAFGYLHGLKDEELPRYLIVSDFERFLLHDLQRDDSVAEFTLRELPANLEYFGFMAGFQATEIRPEDPVNARAAERMGLLHDKLAATGYTGHRLERYLVRLLFCLFAEDTGIFEKGLFRDLLQLHTREDGSDLAPTLALLFEVLDTPPDERLKAWPDHITDFAYVNGELFRERLATAGFDQEMRKLLLDACDLNWSKISPAIFGSLFQSVMDAGARRNLGAHYTSETNILKVVGPLFLDELRAEFERIRSTPRRLREFHDKLAGLRFLDPACGCGNFLVVTYRELRLLELEVLKARFENQGMADVSDFIRVNVDQFYGIEYEEFPAQIAQVAMWLVDHQMNLLVSEAFGGYFVRLPLTASATIRHGNALEISWEDVIPPTQLSYILGNPPFVGKTLQNAAQKTDMRRVFGTRKGTGELDYVAAWYELAARYIQGTNIRVSLVSTNSVSQGEQVSILWRDLFGSYGVKINFAHRTFKWSNDARGEAAVHCVIIGFSTTAVTPRRLFDYQSVTSEPAELNPANINPYLVPGKDLFVEARRTPLDARPRIRFGNMPNDGGNLLLSEADRVELLRLEPEARRFVKPFMSAREYINKVSRWCLWLQGAQPQEIRLLPRVAARVAAVREHRQKSDREATQVLANVPSLFGEIRQPTTNYILVPRHSSENRRYIPMGYMPPDAIVADSCLSIENAGLYHFGVVTSLMHMTWMRYTAGRLKSDYRYSNEIVYNNFPWPEDVNERQRHAVEAAAQAVLDARSMYEASTLAELYSPVTMPPELSRAHQQLDRAVDRAYRSAPFTTELNRVEYLFDLYEALTAPVVRLAKGSGRR